MLDEIKALEVAMNINTHIFLLFEKSMPEEGREKKSISAHFSYHTERARFVSVIGKVICFASLLK
jgi:hypothetical protein